jgi:nucleotide-binding universal stress UspA family protein
VKYFAIEEMTMDSSAPVMVGIDGSTASVRAAVWAADEAAVRDTVLDLIYVVDPAQGHDLDDAMAAGRQALHRAWEAVAKSDTHVKVESELLQGNPVVELANAARRAALICLGHKGAKDSAPKSRGSTVSSLARMAPTNVAVVRRRHTHRPPTFHRWIVAVLDKTPASHAVLQTALDEATLREAPVLALTTWSTNRFEKSASSGTASDIRAEMDHYLQHSRKHPADVHVCALPMPDDVTRHLEQSASTEQLFVVGSGRQDLVDQLTGAGSRKAMRGTNCSVIVVRDASALAPGAVANECSGD